MSRFSFKLAIPDSIVNSIDFGLVLFVYLLVFCFGFGGFFLNLKPVLKHC